MAAPALAKPGRPVIAGRLILNIMKMTLRRFMKSKKVTYLV
jgi:hypothetical protein